MSDDRIDHKAEAERVLAMAGNDPDAQMAMTIAAAAQVHATLYLAEQQRIANLIALSALMLGKEVDQWLVAEIREGLGIR